MGKGGEHPGGQRTAGSSAAALPAATATRTSPSPRDPRLQSARVRLPDGTHRDFELPRGSDGEILFRQVTADLSIEEKEYFSLCFYDQTAARHWLYNDKKILKQLKGLPWEFSYEVKFYPTEPSKLVDDRARFNLYLQLRRDIYSGRLPVTLQTNALLGSFAAQAEFGDAADSPEYSNYLVHAKIAPNMNEQLAQAIAELHKQHKGQTPAEAENHYLETCRELSMYGIFLFPAKDSKNDSVMIGVGAHGINIYKDGVRMHKFSWQNIIKISYRKNSFSIKLKPGELNQKETTVTYKLEDYLHAKRVWKCAVEHHTFFRLIQPEDKPHGSFLGLGSARFRYHGRTQFQTKMASQMFDRPASATIDRSHRLSQSLTDMAREPVHPLHYTDTELDKEQLSPAMSYTLKEHGGPEKRRKHQKTVVTTTKTTKTMEYTPEQTTEGHEGPDDDRLYYSPSTTIESPTGGSYYLSDDGLRSATRSPYSPSSYPEYDPSSPYSDQYSHPAIQSYSHGTAIAVIGSGGSEQRRTQTTPAGYGEVQMRQHSTARRNLFGRPTSSGRSSRTSARLVSYHQPYDPLEPMSTLEYSDLPNTPLAQSVTVYHQGFYNRLEQQQQQEQQRERPPQRPAERPYVATTNGVHRMEELDRGDDMAERPIRHFVDIRHSGSSRPHRIKRIVHEGREEYGKEIDPKDYAFMQQQWEFHPMHQTELAHELRPSNIRQHSNVYYQHTDEAGPSGMQQDDDLPRYRLIARQMPPAPPAPTEERKREREKEKKRRSGEHERRSDRGHITDSHVRAQIYQKEHTASTSIRRESPDSITRSRVSADVSSSSREGSRAAEQRTPMAAVPSPTTKEKKKKQRKRKHPKEASPQESPRRMRLIARIPPTQQSPEGQPSTSSLRFSLWKAARRTRQMDSTPEPTERYVGEMEEIGRQRELEQLDLLNRPAVSQMTPKSVSRRKTMSPIAPKRRKLIGRHRHEGEETVGSPDLSRYGYSTEPYIGHLPQFSRSSELDQSPFDSYVSSRHFEQMIASRDKPKRRAILYLGRTSSPGAAAADLHDEKREVRLIAKVLPQQKEEVASDTLKSRSKEGGTIGFMRKPKKTEKTTTREIGERYEGPLSQTTYSEDIGSLPLEGRPQQVSYSPVPGKVSLVTRKSSEEKEKRRAESPEKIAYPKSKHGYTFDTTPYEGPYESITYEEPLHKEHLPEFVDVYHVGVYEPAKVVEEKQRKSKEQSPEEEHKYSIGFWKKERRSHEAEEWPSSDPYTGALESTHRAHDLTKVELENRPAVVSMSPKTAHKPIPSPKASPKQAKYVLSTDPYLGDLETVRRSTDLEPSSLDSHVAVYKYEEKRTEGAKPKKKAILHIGKSTTPTDETYTEEPREVRLVARILPQQQEFDEPGKEVRDKSKERTSGLFKRGRKSQEPSPAIVAERYTGPVDDVHRENELSELPLAVHPSVSQMPMTSARKSKSTPSPASTTERRYKLWTRVKHEGVEDEVPKERIQITAYNFPSDKYEGELYEFGRSGELEPSSIQEHVSTLPSESIYKAQKGDKRKAILHLKRPRTASPSAEEEQPRQVRLLARVIPPSEQIEEPKTAKIGKEKSPSRFAFVKSRKSTEAKTPEQVERYSGPIEQTSYGEFSGQPLDFQPAAVSYDIKASPKKDKVASPVSTEQRRFRYITRIRHPGDEDIVAKEHVKASAYDFSTAPYEGELYEFGRGSELPSSSIQEHVSSIPPESVYKIQKGGKKKAVLHLKEQRPTSTNALEEEPHQVRLLARVIPPSEQIEEPKTAKIGKEKSPSRFAFVKSRKSTEAKTPELGEHYSGPLEQTSYGEFSGQPLDFQPTAVSYDIKTSPIKSKAKIPSPVTTEERKYRFVTKIRRGEDEDITKKEHVKPSAYDFPTTPYEGELHQTGRIGDIPTEPLQEHVTLQRRISIESDDKKRSQMPLKPESEMFDDDHERFQMHVKSESETFDDDQERFTMDVMRRNVVEEPEPSVRLLARVASPSETEQVDEPKPSKIKKEKSPGRFGFMKPRRSAEVKTPELGEHYSGPLEQTSYGEFSGQPLDFQPTAVSYDIKTSPKKSKAKTTTPVDTEQRRFRYITRIRHGGDEDVVEKEHVKPSAYDFSTTSYEGPLDETTYSELSGTPLDIPTTSVISAKHPAERAASPESEQRRLRLIVRKKKEEEPEKKHITKERPLGASAYDFDHSVYSGPLDETNRVQDIDGHHLHEYVNIRDIPPMPGTLEKKQKKKAIFHLKSPTTTSETPAEEEPHRQVLKVRVMPSEPETSETSRDVTDTDTAKVSFWKKGPRSTRPKETYSSMFSQEKYEGPIDSTIRRDDLENLPVENLPSVSSYSPRTTTEAAETTTTSPRKLKLITRLRHPSAEEDRERKEKPSTPYALSTEPFTGEVDTTGRSQELDGTPLDQHVTIQTPAVETKEKKAKSPKKKAVLHLKESVPETPEERPVRLIARVAQPQEEEPTTSEAAKEKPSRQIGFIKTKKAKTTEFVPEEKYTGPISETEYNELSGIPLDSSISSRPVLPEVTKPIKTKVKKSPVVTSAYDFDRSPYSGQLDEINPLPEMTGSQIREYVNIQDIPSPGDDRKKKAVLHLKRTPSPSVPEQEEHRQVLKVKVQPQEPTEIEQPSPRSSLGFGRLLKKGSRRSTDIESPILSEPYTGPLEVTTRAEELGKVELEARPTVSYSPKKIEKERHQRSGYDFNTDVYEGPLLTTGRVSDIDSTPLSEHANIYHSGIYESPKMGLKEKALRAVTPSKGSSEWEGFEEEPREVRVIARVRHEEEQPIDEEQRTGSATGHRFGFFKTKHEHEASPQELGERYTGPLDQTTYNELSGQPLEVTTYSPKVSPMASPKSAASPSDSEKRRFRLIGVHKEVRGKSETSQYSFSTEPYQGELGSVNYSADIDSQPLDQFVEKREYDYKITKSPKISKTPKTPVEEEKRPIRAKILVRPQDEETETSTSKPSTGFAFLSKKRGHKKEPYNPVLSTATTEVGETQRSGDLEKLPFDISTVSPVHEKTEHEKPTPSDSEQRRLRLIVRKKKEEGEEPVHERVEKERPLRASAYDFDSSQYTGPLDETNRVQDIDGHHLHEYVNIGDIPPMPGTIEKKQKKKAIFHLKSPTTTSETPAEEEPHRQVLKVRVMPSEPETSETSRDVTDTDTAKVSFWKKGPRSTRPKETYSSMFSQEKYEGPIDSTIRRDDLENLPVENLPSVSSYSPRTTTEAAETTTTSPRKLKLITRLRHPSAEEDRERKEKPSTPYALSTEPFTGEVDTTGRSQELDGTPLDQHVTIQTPAVETKEKKAKSPKKKAVLHLKESVPETPEERPVRLIARVAQPQEEEPTTSEAAKEKPSRQIGFIKTKKAKTTEFVPEEKYTGPISETNYNELSGIPLDKSMIPVYREVQTTSVTEKAPSPISTEKRTFRYITRVKHTGDEDVVPKEQVKTSAYDFSTTPYEGELYEFGRGSELPSSSIQEHVSTLPPESIYKAQKEPKRKAILHLKKQKEELPSTIEDEQRQVRLLVKVQPPETEEPSSSAVKEKPSRQIGFIKTKKTKTAEFVPEEKYTGPISETEYNELSGLPLDSSISSRPVLPEVTKPIKTKVKKSPVITSAYDFDRSPYSGQLDEINPLPEMTGSQIREYVNIQDIPVQDDRKKKAVLHLKRTPSPSVPEQEEHRQILKVKVQPQEPTEIEQPSPRSSLGFGRLLKKGSRRSTDIESPILSEPYTGPLEVTARAEELGKVELEARPTVSYSPKKIEKERHQRSGYDFNTDVYEGPLLTTGRVSDIDSTPLSEHANIYHSGIYESPKMGLKEKALRAVTPSKGSSEWEGFEEEPREVRVIARVRHEEEQPIEEEQRTGSATGHRFGFFKTKHEHEPSPQEFGERYTGPLDQTTYNELSGQPLEVTTYSPKASPMASPKSAASPSDSEKRRFRLIGVHKEVRGKSETSQYSFSTEPYQGELGSVNYSADIDSQPLDQFVEKREYDYKITKSPKISKTPVEEEKRPIRAKILVRPQDEEAETSTSKPSTGFAFLSKKRGHKKEPYNPVLSTATTEVGETQRSGDLEKLPFDISTVSPVHEKTEHEKPTPSDSEQRRLRLIVRKKKEEAEEPVHERVEKERPLRASAYDFDRSAYSGPVEETRYNELGGLPLEHRPVFASYDIKTTPRKDKDRAASPATTEQRRFRYITRIRHPGDEDIVAKEHVKTSAYDFSTTPYEGELYEFGRGSELPSSTIHDHVTSLPSESIYETRKGDKRKAILHLKQQKEELPSSAVEEKQRPVRLLARIAPPATEEEPSPSAAREKSPRQIGFLKSRKSKEPAFVPTEKYTGPLEETNYNELSGLPLDKSMIPVYGEVQATSVTEKAPSPISTEKRTFRYITRVKHTGDEDVIPKEQVKTSAYDFSTTPYEGELSEFGRGSELPSSSIQEHVSTLPPESIYKAQKEPKRKTILHLKESKSEQVTEEPQREVRLLARVIPRESEEVLQKPHEAREKSSRQFGLIKAKKTKKAEFVPEEKYTGPLSETAYNELGGLPLEHRPASASYEIKVSPKREKISAYDFSKERYEGRLDQIDRTGDLPSEPILSHVASLPKDTVLAASSPKQRKIKEDVAHLKSEEPEPEQHDIRLKILVKPEQEEYEEKIKSIETSPSKIRAPFWKKTDQPTVESVYYSTEKYEGALSAESPTRELEPMKFDITPPQIRAELPKVQPEETSPQTRIRLLAKVKGKDQDEDVVVEKPQSKPTYSFDTQVYEATEETRRQRELDPSQLRDYVAVYSSGEYAPKAVSSVKKEKKAILHLKSPREDKPAEVIEEQSHPIKLKVLVRHPSEEEDAFGKQPVSPSTPLSSKFRAMIKKPAREYTTFESTKYEGPLDQTARRPDLEAMPLESRPQISQPAVSTKPIKQKKIKAKPAQYDFDTNQYHGDVQEIGRSGELDEIKLRDYITVYHTDETTKTPKKKAVLHLKSPRDRPEEIAEESIPPAKLKILVRPSDEEQERKKQVTAEPGTTRARGFWKRKEELQQHTPEVAGQKYEGPMDETSLQKELESRSLPAAPQVKRASPPQIRVQAESTPPPTEERQLRLMTKIKRQEPEEDVIEQSRLPTHHYQFDTTPYEGNLESMGRIADIEGVPIREHVEIKEIPPSPDKHRRAILHLKKSPTPKEKSSEPELETSREVKLKVLVRPDETDDEFSRPSTSRGTSPFQFGFMKRRPQSAYSSFTTSTDAYTGPISEVSRTPEVDLLPLLATPTSSVYRSASSGDEKMQNRYKLMIRKRLSDRKSKTPDSGYGFDTQPYAGELERTPLQSELEPSDLRQIIPVYHKGESDSKTTDGKKKKKAVLHLKDTDRSPPEEPPRSVRLIALIKPTEDEKPRPKSPPGKRTAFGKSPRSETQQQTAVVERYTGPVESTSKVEELEPLPLEALPILPSSDDEKPTKRAKKVKESSARTSAVEEEPRPVRIVAQVRPEEKQIEREEKTGRGFAFFKTRSSTQEAEPSHAFEKYEGPLEVVTPGRDIENIPLPAAPAEFVQKESPKEKPHSPVLDEERRLKLMAKVRRATDEQQQQQEEPSAPSPRSGYDFSTESYEAFDITQRHPELDTEPIQQHSAVYYHGPYYHLAKLPQKSEDEGRRFGFLSHRKSKTPQDEGAETEKREQRLIALVRPEQQQQEESVTPTGGTASRRLRMPEFLKGRRSPQGYTFPEVSGDVDQINKDSDLEKLPLEHGPAPVSYSPKYERAVTAKPKTETSSPTEERRFKLIAKVRKGTEEEESAEKRPKSAQYATAYGYATTSSTEYPLESIAPQAELQPSPMDTLKRREVLSSPESSRRKRRFPFAFRSAKTTGQERPEISETRLIARVRPETRESAEELNRRLELEGRQLDATRTTTIRTIVRESERTQLHDSVVSYLPSTSELRTYRPARVEGRTVDGQDYVELRVDRRVEVQLEPVYILQSEGLGALSEDEGGIIYTSTATTMSPQSSRRSFFSRFGFTSKGSKRKKPRKGGVKDADSSESSESDDEKRQLNIVLAQSQAQDLGSGRHVAVVLPSSSHEVTMQSTSSSLQNPRQIADSTHRVVRHEQSETKYRLSGEGRTPTVDPHNPSLAATLAEADRLSAEAQALDQSVRLQKPRLQYAERTEAVRATAHLPVSLEESGQPHTTISSFQESTNLPDEVIVEYDQYGNKITRTVKTTQVKHTVQKQTFQNYVVDDQPGAVRVERSREEFTPVGVRPSGTSPIVETHSRTVTYENPTASGQQSANGANGANGADAELQVLGEFVSSKTVTQGNRTIETVTYKTEKDGIVETHVEHRVTIHSEDPIDHDAELSQAILEATQLNPDMTVEKIEVRQESTEPQK